MGTIFNVLLIAGVVLILIYRAKKDEADRKEVSDILDGEDTD